MKNKQQLNRVTENTHLTPGNTLKRTGSLLIDIGLTLLLMVLISLMVVPIMNKVYNYNELISINIRDAKKSYLAELSAPLEADYSNIDTVDLTNNSLPLNKRAEGTYNFYVKFMGEEEPETYSYDWYLENILLINEPTSLFLREVMPLPNPASPGDSSSGPVSEIVEEPKYDDFLPSGVKYKNEINDENIIKINEFNNSIFQDAVRLFNNRPNIRTAATAVMLIDLTSLIIATSIIFLAFPLFLKNGKTLGKLTFNLGLTNNRGYKVNALNILGRYFSFLTFNLLPLLFFPTLGLIMLLISLTLMVFNKKAKALHDFFAMTMVVDEKKSTIYLRESDYLSAQAIIEASGSRSSAVNEEMFEERLREDSGA